MYKRRPLAPDGHWVSPHETFLRRYGAEALAAIGARGRAIQARQRQEHWSRAISYFPRLVDSEPPAGFAPRWWGRVHHVGIPTPPLPELVAWDEAQDGEVSEEPDHERWWWE